MKIRTTETEIVKSKSVKFSNGLKATFTISEPSGKFDNFKFTNRPKACHFPCKLSSVDFENLDQNFVNKLVAFRPNSVEDLQFFDDNLSDYGWYVDHFICDLDGKMIPTVIKTVLLDANCVDTYSDISTNGFDTVGAMEKFVKRMGALDFLDVIEYEVKRAYYLEDDDFDFLERYEVHIVFKFTDREMFNQLVWNSRGEYTSHHQLVENILNILKSEKENG